MKSCSTQCFQMINGKLVQCRLWEMCKLEEFYEMLKK